MNDGIEELRNHLEKALSNPYLIDRDKAKKYLDSINNLLQDNEDLKADNEHLKEELKNLQQNIEDNYRPIPISEQVEISDRDFI